ncbi:TPA: hypothetical protein I7730_16115 [Vibrio vulnificus]|uniref:Uncharacterized protein n=1 Tax=Vibrio vulnificus TaxID=672 RepID=A0A8H9N211_VIBVL|nr:hypothetical protein [Vibrio vulnificus]HAS8541309.1 hypothetical protein [Vibrio vulnificus]
MYKDIITIQSLLEAQGISLAETFGKRVQYNFNAEIHGLNVVVKIFSFTSGVLNIQFHFEQNGHAFTSLHLDADPDFSEEKDGEPVIVTYYDSSQCFKIQINDRFLKAIAKDLGTKPYIIQMVQAEVARIMAQFLGEFEGSDEEKALHAYARKHKV